MTSEYTHTDSEFAAFFDTAEQGPDPGSDPIGAIEHLIARIEARDRPFRKDLKRIIAQAGGVSLDSPEQLRRFKEVFTHVSHRLDICPLLPSGKRGSMQVTGGHNGKAYSNIHSSREHVGGGVSANTVPYMDLG